MREHPYSFHQCAPTDIDITICSNVLVLVAMYVTGKCHPAAQNDN